MGEEGDKRRHELGFAKVSQNRFDPSCDSKFPIDVMQMCLHRVDGHTQLIGDVLISSSRRRMGQYFLFSL